MTKRDPAVAEAAGLTYVNDAIPGISRERRGAGWTYLRPDGAPIVDPDERARIDAIGIPPAWTQVWISPTPNGHILATGRDARGRKQYRYHPRWRQVRDATKYHRMAEFGQQLPGLRRRADSDLDRPGLPRERVLAAAIRLMDETLIRIGNEEYARQNHTFGLTTLRREHVKIEGPDAFMFEFRAKSGKEQRVRLADLAARAEAAGLHVDLSVDGATDNLPPMVEPTAYRVLQEALTNVIRHSGARSVAVTVRRQDATLLVQVTDDGTGPSGDTGVGLGLTGMRERVDALSGHLTAGIAAGGGYQVTAVLPL